MMRHLALLALLLFTGAQFVEVIHSSFDEHHVAHSCCKDGLPETHVDSCDEGHDQPECPICTSLHKPVQTHGAGFTFTVSIPRIQLDRVESVVIADPAVHSSSDPRAPPRSL